MSRKLTQEEFISKAKVAHGNRYDYSKSVCNGGANKITIICHKHREFRQTAAQHIRGSGCPACYEESKIGRITSKRFSQEQFLEAVKKVHGDKYDYSKSVYAGNRSKITIICRKHGSEFIQQAADHMSGNRCPACGREDANVKKMLSLDEFIRRSNLAHKNKYRYDKTVFDGTLSKVIITCLKHGDFQPIAKEHLRGDGKCRQCVEEEYQSRYAAKYMKRFIEVHGDEYDYSKVKYVNAHNKVLIRCFKHGEFYQTPGEHISGCGCPICGTEATRISQEVFIERCVARHGDKYDYSMVKYAGSNYEITIKCPEHGYFSQRAKTHSDGGSCPLCAESSGERAVRLFLDAHSMKYEREYTKHGCRYKHIQAFDFAVFNKDVSFVEFHGKQHYAPISFGGSEDPLELFKVQQMRDASKRRYCKKHQIPLLEIPYWQINEVNDLLADFLGVAASA